MNLTTTWVEISTSSVVLQRHGAYGVALVYSVAAPAPGPVEEQFTLQSSMPQYFPAVTGEGIWARATSGTATLSAKEVA
tara:strand:+ start:2666 stop:2902 length:237 start_codon:yes stop_codon:yes gene_type:complete